jgi:sec-independent protein translocase protein TatA
MSRFGWQEIVLIILVILLFFGATKLPALMRAIGRSLGEFKKGQQEGARPDEKSKENEPNKTS